MLPQLDPQQFSSFLTKFFLPEILRVDISLGILMLCALERWILLNLQFISNLHLLVIHLLSAKEYVGFLTQS